MIVNIDYCFNASEKQVIGLFGRQLQLELGDAMLTHRSPAWTQSQFWNLDNKWSILLKQQGQCEAGAVSIQHKLLREWNYTSQQAKWSGPSSFKVFPRWFVFVKFVVCRPRVQTSHHDWEIKFWKPVSGRTWSDDHQYNIIRNEELF